MCRRSCIDSLYQVDDDEVATVLSLDEYDGDDEASWLLLESVATE